MAQIKERVIILLTLAVFSLSFLCRCDLGSIPAVYVGVNSMRDNIITTAIYYADIFPVAVCTWELLPRFLTYVL